MWFWSVVNNHGKELLTRENPNRSSPFSFNDLQDVKQMVQRLSKPQNAADQHVFSLLSKRVQSELLKQSNSERPTKVLRDLLIYDLNRYNDPGFEGDRTKMFSSNLTITVK